MRQGTRTGAHPELGNRFPGSCGVRVVHWKKKQPLSCCLPEPLLPSGGTNLDPHEGHQPRHDLLLAALHAVTGDGLPGPEGAAVRQKAARSWPSSRRLGEEAEVLRVQASCRGWKRVSETYDTPCRCEAAPHVHDGLQTTRLQPRN